MAALPLLATGAKPESVPPVTTMSDRSKFLEASDRTMLMTSLPPAVRLPVPVRDRATVGGVVSGVVVL